MSESQINKLDSLISRFESALSKLENPGKSTQSSSQDELSGFISFDTALNKFSTSSSLINETEFKEMVIIY